MAEEKIVKINLRKELVKVPRWERRAKFLNILRRRLKAKDLVVDKKLNGKIWSDDSMEIRLKLVKDDKSVKAYLVE